MSHTPEGNPMTSFTPEPWTVVERTGDYFIDGLGHGVASLHASGGASNRSPLANAARIVACVNACTRFSTEWLQEHAGDYLWKHAQDCAGLNPMAFREVVEALTNLRGKYYGVMLNEDKAKVDAILAHAEQPHV